MSDTSDTPEAADVLSGPLGEAFGWAYEILSLAPDLTREAVDLIVTDLGANGDDVSTLCRARVDAALEAYDEALDDLEADDATRARRNTLAWLWLEALVTGLKHGKDGQAVVNVFNVRHHDGTVYMLDGEGTPHADAHLLGEDAMESWEDDETGPVGY